MRRCEGIVSTIGVVGESKLLLLIKGTAAAAALGVVVILYSSEACAGAAVVHGRRPAAPAVPTLLLAALAARGCLLLVALNLLALRRRVNARHLLRERPQLCYFVVDSVGPAGAEALKDLQSDGSAHINFPHSYFAHLAALGLALKVVAGERANGGKDAVEPNSCGDADGGDGGGEGRA